MSAMAGDVTAKAGQHWDKLESIFEQRTAKAMNKLGVPTAKDVDALIKRVDELAAAVARLSKATPAKTAPAPAKTAAKPAAKAAAKKSTPRAPAQDPQLIVARTKNAQGVAATPAQSRADAARARASAWRWPAAARSAPSTRSARCARCRNRWTASTSTTCRVMSACRPAASSPRAWPTA